MSTAGSSSLREPLVTFFVATALASATYWAARALPALDQVLHGTIAVIFLYAPAVAARLSGRPFDYQAAGLRVTPVGRNAAVLAAAVAFALPAFFLAFLLFYGFVCDAAAPVWARSYAEAFAPVCPRWLGLAGAELRLPPGFALRAMTQLVVIALPEELFFRGYLYQRLEGRWPGGRMVLGARVGWPLFVSSALFALGHVLVDFQVQRLAVFFPALVFGWMRARTGSVAAAAVFHALCNLFSDLVHTSFFA